jgi:Flp pilus assembly protein TadG
MFIRRHCFFVQSRLQGFLGRFFHDRRGVAVVLVALALPVLIGTMGVAAETSYWYMHQRSMQNAADAAAIAAATAGAMAAATNTTSTYATEAQQVAANYGFSNGSGNITVTAANPSTATNCTSGCYTATVSDKVPLFLSKVIGYTGDPTNSGTTAMSASATATIWGGAYCILALSGSVTDDIVSNGAPKANLNGCNIMSNTSALCHGSNLNANVGDAHGTDSNCGILPESNVPTVPDPYSQLASNIPSDPCGGTYYHEGKKGSGLPASNQWSGSISPGTYQICGDLQLTGNTTISAPGNTLLVIYNGTLDTNGNTLQTATNAGLTIVFTGSNGSSSTQYPTGGGTLDIAAPTSGTWSGMAIYDIPATSITYAGNSPTWSISGMVYFPNASVTISGAVNKSSNGSQCFGMTVGSMTINGTGDIIANVNCAGAGLVLPHQRGTLVN